LLRFYNNNFQKLLLVFVMKKSRNWFSWSKSTPPNTDAFIVFLFWWERNQRDRVKKVMKRIKLCRSAAMGGARQVAGELIIGALESICRSSIYLLPCTIAIYHRHSTAPTPAVGCQNLAS